MSTPLEQVSKLEKSMAQMSSAVYEQGPSSQEASRAARLAEAQMLALVSEMMSMEEAPNV